MIEAALLVVFILNLVVLGRIYARLTRIENRIEDCRLNINILLSWTGRLVKNNRNVATLDKEEVEPYLILWRSRN